MFKTILTTIAAAIGVTVLVSTCASDPLTQEEIIRSQISHDMNKDKEELSKLVQEMKEQDPKITEAFYSIDDEGKRVVNVVRQSDDNNGAYMVAGMAAGMSAMMLMNNLNQDRDRKRSGGGGYVHSAFNNSQTMGKGSVNSLKRSAKSKYISNVRKTSTTKVRSGRATVSSRSSAFSGSSSARSSGYSSGS